MTSFSNLDREHFSWRGAPPEALACNAFNPRRSMYIPPAHRVEDPVKVRSFIEANGFATVITTGEDGAPFASHLPVLLDVTPDGEVLRSHMARSNEQWRHFASGKEVLCIFHGPHAYISPSWYVSKNTVPTWTYAVVHVYGVPTVENDPAVMRAVIDDTTAKYEAGMPKPWTLNLPEPAVAGLMNALVAFAIRVTRIEAKFKIGQNRSAEDQAGMLAALSTAADSASRELADFIRESASGPAASASLDK
jgi:transcriptional regulator